jgi:hypothetical protein
MSKLFSKVKKFFSYSWEEDFLSGAKDHAELERRQKLIANGYTQHYSIYTRKGYI